MLSLMGGTRKEEVMLPMNVLSSVKRRSAFSLAAMLIKSGLNFTVLLRCRLFFQEVHDQNDSSA